MNLKKKNVLLILHRFRTASTEYVDKLENKLMLKQLIQLLITIFNQ